MEELLKSFGNDPVVQSIAALVALDVILGVAAALKSNTFRFVLLADFLRNDVLAKLVPYAGLWIVLSVSGDFEIGGVSGIQDVVGVGILASLGASVLNSLRDLGLFSSAPDVIAGPDPESPG